MIAHFFVVSLFIRLLFLYEDTNNMRQRQSSSIFPREKFIMDSIGGFVQIPDGDKA